MPDNNGMTLKDILERDLRDCRYMITRSRTAIEEHSNKVAEAESALRDAMALERELVQVLLPLGGPNA